MKALDLFCGAGGASKGLANAGFQVTGVDIAPQPRYPFEFIQGDALTAELSGFDFIWASPPCQAHTALKSMPDARPHVDFIPAIRTRLRKAGVPYIIENVVGAPLKNPIRLCGTGFGLGVSDAELRRHRIFECSFPAVGIDCRHKTLPRTIGIYGEGCRDSRRKHDKTIPEFTVVHGRRAMGIEWMTIAELCEAIPPAYSEFLAKQFLKTYAEGEHADGK